MANAERRAGMKSVFDDYLPEYARSSEPTTADEMREYKRGWQRRKRESERLVALAGGRAVRIVASLHGLACTGTTKRTGCRCTNRLYVIAS